MGFVFLGLGIFCICVIISALVLLLQGDGAKDQKLMQYFLLGSLVQNVGYLLELTAATQEAAIVAVKMQYLGSLAVPISYCYFIFSYCFEKIPEKIFGILRVADVLVLCLVFTCDRHPFYYSQIGWETADGHGYLSLSYGPGYWLFMLCGTVVPYFLSQRALIRACIEKQEYAADRKYRLILVLSCFPVVALASYSMKLAYVYDPTPVVLGLTLSGVIILIWSRKVYDFSSLASGILLDSMSDGMIAVDEQRRIVNYNPAAAGIFPELSHTVGKQIKELADFPPDILGEDVNAEFSRNGRFYQGHVKQIIDRFGQGKGYVVLLLDVTETRDYIEEIKRVREEAEQANIAKSAFLANMSHEIRTPMNAIVGLSDVIMEESKGRKVYEYACDIKTSSRNLLALINDILDLSKVEAGKMELVLGEYHLKAMVDEVLNMLEMAAYGRGISLKSEYDLSIPCRYLGDEGRLKQILINILNNALKFTKEGHVKISVTGERGAAPDMERLYFKIEDTGCGIRKEDLGKIFENFRQVDSKRNRSIEGTGLGLSITKHLVELMQGTVQVNSVYGEGTMFIVEVPQKIADYRPLSEVMQEAVEKEEEMEPFFAEGCKVLTVDDNPINRKVARIFLQSYHFDLSEAASGKEAIDLVRRTRYDLIFMDHMMPQMDGIEAVKLIRKECGENGTSPVIIALTANAMEGVRENFLANGFQDFLAKPLGKKQLHEVLLRWVPKEKRTPGKALAGGGTPDGALAGEVMPDEAVADEAVADEVTLTGAASDKATSAGAMPDSSQLAARRDGECRCIQHMQIEGIDIEEVLGRYGGSPQEYQELLELYCLDGKRKLAILRNLWETQDYKSYGIEVHGLKSASASIGAMKLSQTAKEHELAVDRGDLTFVDSNVTQLLVDYGEQIGHIRGFLEKNRKAGGAGKIPAGEQDKSWRGTSYGNQAGNEEESQTGNKDGNWAKTPAGKQGQNEIGTQVLIQELSEALGRLENFRAKECLRKIEGLFKYRLPGNTEAGLMEIRDQLKLYEDAAAEQMLRELMAQIRKGEGANGGKTADTGSR